MSVFGSRISQFTVGELGSFEPVWYTGWLWKDLLILDYLGYGINIFVVEWFQL